MLAQGVDTHNLVGAGGLVAWLIFAQLGSIFVSRWFESKRQQFLILGLLLACVAVASFASFVVYTPTEYAHMSRRTTSRWVTELLTEVGAVIGSGGDIWKVAKVMAAACFPVVGYALLLYVRGGSVSPSPSVTSVRVQRVSFWVLLLTVSMLASLQALIRNPVTLLTTALWLLVFLGMAAHLVIIRTGRVRTSFRGSQVPFAWVHGNALLFGATTVAFLLVFPNGWHHGLGLLLLSSAAWWTGTKVLHGVQRSFS